jgi:CRP-like cAMP-binding protein
MSLFDYHTVAQQSNATTEHTILGSLSEREWSRLLTHVEQLRFKLGDYLIRAGQVDRSLFILLSGSVAVTREQDKEQVELARFTEGEVIGEIAFFDGAPRSADVRATSDGTAVRISRDKFEYLSAWEPDLARTLLLDLGSVLAARLRETTQLFNNRAAAKDAPDATRRKSS